MPSPSTQPAPMPPVQTAPALLVLSWLVVTLPTLWGLSYTVRNALKLFAPHPTAATTAPSTAPAPAAPSTH